MPSSRVRKRAGRCLIALAMLAVPALAACGSGGTDNVVRWFVFQEPSGAYDRAAASCSDGSDGRYRIEIQPLPTNANTQREQLVRRLAAEDESIDLMGMDVIWTAEFAAAGWIEPWTGDRRTQASDGLLDGPLQSAIYQDSLFAAPFTSNTQLLWYRKSRVPEVPQTWDQMIDQATSLPAGQRLIEAQGNRYEGYTVWINALVESAGGQIVADPDRGQDATASMNSPEATRALRVVQRLATSTAADPSLSVATEDTTRLAFESGSASYMVNYSFVYPSAQQNAPEVYADMGWARYPGVDDGESAPPLGGINLGVSRYSQKPDLAFDAALCLRSQPVQTQVAVDSGLAPVSSAVYDDPAYQQAAPYAETLRESIADAAPRPVTPAYNDISLAVQRSLHPPSSLDPQSSADAANDLISRALESKALL